MYHSVTQYDENGVKVETFDSINDAIKSGAAKNRNAIVE